MNSTCDLNLNNINDNILKLCWSNKKQLEQAKAIKLQIKFNENEVYSTILTAQEKKQIKNYIFFDIETQLLSHEVGGWGNIDKMKVAVVCLYSSREDKFYHYTEEQVTACIEKLKEADLVIGFNNKCFDNIVLRPYTDFNLSSLPTFDILEEINKKLHHRVKLQSLAEATLDAGKIADGLQAVEWFKKGKIDEVKKYCQKDVEITRNLFYYAKENGYLKYTDKTGDIKTVELEAANV